MCTLWVCIVVREKGRGQAILIGSVGQPVTPTGFNSNGVNFVAQSLFVHRAAPVQTDGRDGRPDCTNRSRVVTPNFFPTIDRESYIRVRKQPFTAQE
ncbi:hypothetical protein Y032_0207g2015 [Ancylostoma ceylanicum]|uniref:Uncharacterized protein n=1 Tax=Ancylostoma ceylanicum TaxID=53326 RepID=A0A016SKY3_9BILA|nr:hypothetical protein Y032_0207g2015 [Ancylostoma ceylanicum]